MWIPSVARRVLSCAQFAQPWSCDCGLQHVFRRIVQDEMPKETANAEAILEAIKKIEIVSELLADKNKNNLKMIAEGKVSGGKQIGPYAHLLTYSPGEVIMSQGDWGGNTFYFSVDGSCVLLGLSLFAGRRRIRRRAIP